MHGTDLREEDDGDVGVAADDADEPHPQTGMRKGWGWGGWGTARIQAILFKQNTTFINKAPLF